MGARNLSQCTNNSANRTRRDPRPTNLLSDLLIRTGIQASPDVLKDIKLQAVRNGTVDFLAIVPSPPQSIFQLYTFSTGETVNSVDLSVCCDPIRIGEPR